MDAPPHAWRTPALVALLGLALYAPFLGAYGLFDPWETHYGEVGRGMLESGDWISPWWGSSWPEGPACKVNGDCEEGSICIATRAEFLPRPATCRPKSIRREGAYFFSKPALSLWMMAGGMAVGGVGPGGMRWPFVLVALYGVFALTWCVRRLFDERLAALTGMLMLGAPMYALLARQAVTDLPFVALLTAGLAHLALGWFAPGRDAWSSRRARWLITAALIVVVAPMVLHIGLTLDVHVRLGRWRVFVGPIHAAIEGLGLMALCGWVWLRPPAGARPWQCWRYRPGQRTVGELHLLAAYGCLGLSALAKGLLAVAIPGAVVLLYLLVTGRWRSLRTVRLPMGVLTFGLTAVPWYAAMLARHGWPYYERFFIHDHFKRLATGVHQLDGGAFDHFILWLGLGTFPWAALLPVALWTTWRFRGPKHQSSFVVLAQVWCLLSFTLFTVAKTKFHHYIFPAVPPAAFLVSLSMLRLQPRQNVVHRIAIMGALVLYGAMAWSLAVDPQRIINLITYMYDREWPPQRNYGPFLSAIGVLGALPLVVWLGARSDRVVRLARGAFVAFALFFSAWINHRYMPGISSTWSQQALFDAYYARCTPSEPPLVLLSGRRICRQPIVAYKLNWRGETFHSDNTVIPLRDDKDLDYFLSTDAGGKEFFVLVEHTRLERQFKPKLSLSRRQGLRRVHEENAKFVLVRVPGRS